MEKEDVPLDRFFEICAPLVGIISPSEYQQTMGWQLSPAKAGDEVCYVHQKLFSSTLTLYEQEKVPQLTRSFVPSLNMLSEKYTTTSLGVDDLVKHCYAVGYAGAESNGTPSAVSSGSLTMAVQSTAAAADAANALSEKEIEQAVRAVLSDRPAGETTLSNATTAVDRTGATYPYNETFDPTSDFDINFNPNSLEFGGAWDAFDPTMIGTDTMGIDWEAFINSASFT